MAILVGTQPVNNGNEGWTHADVMDALEQVFANLQMHGGTAKNGVPVGVASPVNKVVGYNSSYWSDWKHVGGRLNSWGTDYRYFDVLADGTSKYKILEKHTISSINGSGYESMLYLDYNRQLKTGDAVVWCPDPNATADDNITGLQLNTTYYIIRENSYRVKLALSESDAIAGNHIDLSSSSQPVNGWTSKSILRRPDVAGNENLTIEVLIEDHLIFDLDPSLPGNFKICSGNSYAADKVYELGNAGNFAYDPYQTSDYPTEATNNGITTVTWDTEGSAQSEDEVYDIGYESPTGVGSESIGRNKIVEYCYANDTHTDMKGVIKLLPNYSTSTNTDHNPYWKYTVPGTDVGLSSPAQDLKLKIWRWSGDASSSYRGYIYDIEICNIVEGWSDNAVFTIPAAATMATFVDPNKTSNNFDQGAVDIVFGVNTANTTDGAYDGKPNLITTNFGATGSFFQKCSDGHHAVLKVVHDSAKNYGTSYYAFSMPSSNHSQTNYRLMVKSGSYFDVMNTVADKIPENATSATKYGGYFRGEVGLDYQTGQQYIYKGDGQHQTYYNIATTSTSTSYPLEIRYYRAQSTQDTNFGFIQFVQNVNSIPYTYWTLHIPRGNLFGNPNPGIDLDHLYHGSIFSVVDNSAAIELQSYIPGYNYTYYSEQSTVDEPKSAYSKARDSMYGYMRQQGGGNWYSCTKFECNIHYNNDPYSDWKIYYRDSTYDGTHADANYYKPIKGIPIMGNFIPCPYYMPDDFVLIQVSAAPGLTEFRTGDEITVSSSEKYVVIVGAVLQSQEGLNEVAGDSSVGMLFCGRIPN